MYMFFYSYNAKIKKIETDRTVLYLIRIMYQEPKSTNKLINIKMGNTINTTPVTLTGEEYRQMEEEIEIEQNRAMLYDDDGPLERQWSTINVDYDKVERNNYERFMTITVQSTEQECCCCLEPTKDTTICRHYLCRDCAGKLTFNYDNNKECPMCRQNLIVELTLFDILKCHQINNSREGSYYIEEKLTPEPIPPYLEHQDTYKWVIKEIQNTVKEVDPSRELDLFYELIAEIEEKILYYHLKKVE